MEEFRALEQRARHFQKGLWAQSTQEPSASRRVPPAATGADTVYVTRTGKKYHRETCMHLRKSKIPMKLDDAAAQYQIAISIEPGYSRAHYNLGNVFFRQGNLEQAVAQYERTLAVDPEYAQAHNNLGIVYATQGRLAQAEAAFVRALEIDPDYTEARLNFERARGNSR